MPLIFIRILFYAMVASYPLVHAAEGMLSEVPVDLPPPPEVTSPTAEATATTTTAEATPQASPQGPDAQSSQLKWPDTIEINETAVGVVAANETTGVNQSYEKAQKAVTEMETAIKEMTTHRTKLYGDFFEQSARTDDFIQENQVELGSLGELFNPSDKK